MVLFSLLSLCLSTRAKIYTENGSVAAQSTPYSTALKMAGSMALHLKHGFSSSFAPSIVDLSGQIVLIGDNLDSYFSSEVLEYCSKSNVFFIYLPPNSTHICQLLDVAVLRPAKIESRDILDTWQRESR